MYTKMTQYIDIKIQAASDNEELSYTLNRTDDIVRKSDDFALSIERLRIPSSNIDFYRLDDVTDHSVGFTTNLKFISANESAGEAVSATNTLYTHTEMKLNSVDDLLNNVNNKLILSHKDFIESFSSSYKVAVNTSGTLDEASPSLSFDFSALPTNAKPVAIEVVINTLTYTDTDANDYNAKFRMILENPSTARKTLLCANKDLDGLSTVKFADWYAIDSQRDDLGKSAVNYQPLDLLSKNNTTTADGTWKITLEKDIETTNLFTVAADVTLNITYAPVDMSIPVYSP